MIGNRDEINIHKVSGTASQQQELLVFCLNIRRADAIMFALSLALLWGKEASLCQYLMVSHHVDQTFPRYNLFPPPVFGRNTCS